MSFQHPPEQYCTIPTRTPARTLGLTRVLITEAPKQPPPSVAKRLARMHEKALALQSAWIDANRPVDDVKKARPYDLRVDRNWRIWHDRIEHWVKIEHPDHAEEAGELFELLFPTGLDFIMLPFEEQWAESQRRLVLIKEDQLGPKLADLIDQRFVDSLHEAHEAYGKVLGITEAKPAPVSPAGVREALEDLRKELSAYARLVLGLGDPDDDEAIATAEAQLGAVIRFRKPRASAEEAEEAEEPVEAPVPEPPQAG